MSEMSEMFEMSDVSILSLHLVLLLAIDMVDPDRNIGLSVVVLHVLIVLALVDVTMGVTHLIYRYRMLSM